MESGSDYVVKLNLYAQTKQLKPPQYKDLGSSGLPHLREFRQSVHFDGRDFPEGVGRSKKDAKHNAAKKACEILFNGNPDQSSTNNSVSPDGDAKNFIGKISEYCQQNKCSSNYIEVSKEGPSHDPIFSYKLEVDNKKYPVATGKTVKEAKQKAAQLAWSELCQDTKGTADESFSEDQVPDPSLTTHASQVSEETDFISKVAGYCQQHNYTHSYKNVRQEGPPHDRLFYYNVVIDNKDYPEAQGKTVREAKQKAAHSAWSLIRGDLSTLDSKSESSAGFDTSELSARCSESSDGSSWIQFEGSSKSVQSQPVSKPQDDTKEKNGASDQSATSTHSKIHTEYDSYKRLGKGTFGCVYKARNKDLDSFSAIKEVETKNREKSLLEVKALKALNHPNIVRYFTFWFEDTGYLCSGIKPNSEVLFIEMELCDGGTLRRWIHEQNKETLGAARREQSLKIALQILNGVEFFHKKKLIHRDLKPENILFGQDGDVKIGDFGLVTTDNDEEIVERTEDRGTPNYMAPEQVGVNYDRKVDIFALGLICFELFWRIATGHERVAIWPNVRCQTFPTEFTATYAIESHIIKTMLSKNPEARPEASALKIELEKWNKEAMDDQGNQTV